MTLFDQGFAVIENCFSQPACDAIIEQLDAIFGIGTRCLLDYEWCQSLATPLKGRVEKSIPEIASLVAVQCTFFNKSPNSKWFVAYHQDRSIPVLSSVSSEDWPGWSQKEGTTFRGREPRRPPATWTAEPRVPDRSQPRHAARRLAVATSHRPRWSVRCDH